MKTPRFQVQNLSLERNGRPVLRDVSMVVAAGRGDRVLAWS
jgi:ABC-type molybdenum transport system ATPase subunit/photorepair protein PhrA